MVEALEAGAVLFDVVCAPEFAEEVAAGGEFADEVAEFSVVRGAAGFSAKDGDHLPGVVLPVLIEGLGSRVEGGRKRLTELDEIVPQGARGHDSPTLVTPREVRARATGAPA